MREEQRMYFLALCRAGSISTTATRLHISRQGLSRSILALEKELGVALFRRTRRGVQPTEAGTLLKDCLDAQDEMWDACLTRIRSLKTSTAQVERVGLRDVYCDYHDKRAFYSFRKEHPDVAVETRDVDFDEMWDLLQNGTLDFAVSLLPPPSYEFRVLSMRGGEVSVLMSEDNPLAARDSVDFDSDLRGMTVVQPSAYLKRLYLPYYRTRGISLKYVDADRNSLRALVASCDDVFIAMEVTARGLLAEGLTVRPLTNNPLGEHDLDSCILFTDAIADPARRLLLELSGKWGLRESCEAALAQIDGAEGGGVPDDGAQGDGVGAQGGAR